MKRILITGAGSYIGTSVENWLKQPRFAGKYQVDTVDMQGEEWKTKDFSAYDTVFHVAGIAHMKETKENRPLYYQVNRDLAIAVAKEAKRSGVGQFILLSSMSIYGMETGTITKKTIPKPINSYGKSKYQAETAIQKMSNEKFRIVVIRPPMVYGKECKGNYRTLSKFAKVSPIFPYVINKRSMLYIDNLSEFIRIIIEDKKAGIFFPQNQNYVCTGELVKIIAGINGHRIFLLMHIEKLILLFGGSIARKVLGSLIYDIEEDRCETVSFIKSIRDTEA